MEYIPIPDELKMEVMSFGGIPSPFTGGIHLPQICLKDQLLYILLRNQLSWESEHILDIILKYSGDIRGDSVDVYITLSVDLTDELRKDISPRVLTIDSRYTGRRSCVLRVHCHDDRIDVPSIQIIQNILNNRLEHVTYTDSILDIPNSFQYPPEEACGSVTSAPRTDTLLSSILELDPNFNVVELHRQAWIHHDLFREVLSGESETTHRNLDPSDPSETTHRNAETTHRNLDPSETTHRSVETRCVHGFWIIPELITQLKNTTFRYRGTYMSIMASDNSSNILEILQNLGCQKIHRCGDLNHIHLNISIIPRRVLSCMYCLSILAEGRSIVV